VSAADEDQDTGPDAFFRRWLRSMGITLPDAIDDAAGNAVDAQGRFQLGSLPPGEAELVAHAPGYFRSTVKLTDLAAGKGKDGLKVVLEPATAWIDGTVVDQDDKPVAGAEVSAFGDEGPAGSAKTDAQGKFKIVKVRSRGPVRLDVEAKGYVDEHEKDVPLNSSGHRVSVTKAARVKVKVLDAEGKPVASATVRLKVEADGERASTHHYPGFDQPEGGYDLETRPGRVEVHVSAAGHPLQLVGSWKLAPGQVLDAGAFTLARGKPGEGPGPEDEDGEGE
jgi:hypothetical protein